MGQTPLWGTTCSTVAKRVLQDTRVVTTGSPILSLSFSLLFPALCLSSIESLYQSPYISPKNIFLNSTQQYC